MKKFIILIFVILTFENVKAQYYVVSPTQIFTPKSSSIQSLIFTGVDYTTPEKNTIKNDILNTYPGTQYVGEATMKYNCHNYAWHMSSGGNKILWINQNNTSSLPNVQKYWLDGSYVEVCNESQATKVFYYNGDHSASISTTVPGMYESKWADLILVRHSANNVLPAYNSASRKYYISSDIIGSPAELCSGTRIFSAPVITGAIYTWSVNSSLLSIVSGQGTHQLTIQRNGNNIGQGWVEVQISTPCSSGSATSKKLNFRVGVPNNPGNIIGDNSPGPGSVKAYLVSGLPAGANMMNWILPYCYSCNQAWSFYSGPNSTQMVANVGDSAGYVQAMGNNACGNGGVSLLYVTPSGGCDPCAFVYPNPASEELVLEWRSDKGAEISGFKDDYEVAIFDSKGSIKWTGTSNSSLLRMDITNLNNGLYYIHILDSKGLVRKQIKIEK